jgi:glyoxylase-like metal-dependent hydrolase (beta-lactamase superfamily II)
MQVRSFSTGRVRPKRGDRGVRRYLVEDWSDHTLPVNIFLVEHPDGYCLVDTGQTAKATRPGYFDRWYPFFRLSRFELSVQDEAASQLSMAGIDPTDIRWVVLTHLHTDHVGGIAPFAPAKVFVSREEWEPAQGLGGRLRGYQPQYWPQEIRPHTVDFAGPGVGPFRSSHDVAGDGRLLMVPLPGHTRGHAGLVVLEQGQPRWLLGGDAAHDVAELDEHHPDIADWRRAEGVEVLLAHDDAALRRLRGGPKRAT